MVYKLPDKLSVPTFTVRYQGLYDFDGLYAAVIDWAKNYGYMWHEQTYKHKVPSPKGAVQEWLWLLDKNVTEYIAYSIKIKAKAYDLTEVEVETESGRKKILTSGKIKIILSGTTNVDWQKKFKGSKVKEWYHKMFKHIFVKEITSGFNDVQHYRLLNLQAMVKKYLDLQTKYYSHKGYLKEDL